MDLTKIYRAADYLRLSKEDGDSAFLHPKKESNSISSQRELIESFVRNQPDIRLVAEYVDDGYSGTNFDRPHFHKMMEAVERREIDCIIVKDLSRFGREYIDAGQYIEKLFPQKGIRFIAINDHYDSLSSAGSADHLIVPFKNLINDSYSRDISVKVRANLEVKRQRGEFIGNFAPYGYRRDPEDKNKLLVDEVAAEVVRNIYRWKIDGLNPAKIAQRLNESGTPCPMAYKRACGSKYSTGFSTDTRILWSALAVRRVLTNDVYCGTLIQGKRTTINYKVRRVIYKDAEQWVRIENSHEAIINPAQFNLVQQLMDEDCRIGKGEDAVRPLSGRVFCGDCLSLAKRKVVTGKSKRYAYYSCPGQCGSRTISEQDLEDAVLAILRAEISTILNLEQTMKGLDALAWERRELSRLDINIAAQENAEQKVNMLRISVYEDFKDGLIDKDDLEHIKGELSRRAKNVHTDLAALRLHRAEVAHDLAQGHSWLSQFQKYRNLTVLTRAVVVNLVSRVLLFPNKTIEVELRHKDQVQQVMAYLTAREVG